MSAHIEPAAAPATGHVFIAIVSAPSMSNGNFMFAAWAGLSAQGAVAKDIASNDPLTSAFTDSVMDVQLPDGAIQGGGGRQTNKPSPTVNDRESDAELSAAARQVLNKYGLTLSSARIYHPLHAAIAIKCVVRDQDKIRGKIGEVQQALYDLGLFESVYIEIDSSSGRKLSIQTWDLFAGGGMGYNAAGYDYLGTPHA